MKKVPLDTDVVSYLVSADVVSVVETTFHSTVKDIERHAIRRAMDTPSSWRIEGFFRYIVVRIWQQSNMALFLTLYLSLSAFANGGSG